MDCRPTERSSRTLDYVLVRRRSLNLPPSAAQRGSVGRLSMQAISELRVLTVFMAVASLAGCAPDEHDLECPDRQMDGLESCP